MEIITLVKAGIRNRKGIMIGFMLLTMLIVVSVVSMIGVRKNYESAKEKAFEIEDKGTIASYFQYDTFSDKLKEKVLAEDTVDFIECYDALCGVNVTVGDKTDGNGFVVSKMMDTVPIFNDKVDSLYMPGSEEHSGLKLQKGEIYVPYGLQNKLSADIGDKITMDFLGQPGKEFTIKGYVQEAFMGSSIIGWKIVYISDEDFDDIYSSVLDNFKDPKTDKWAYGKTVFVHPSEKADKSSDKFLRELTLDTRFNDKGLMVITRETSEHYTGLFINIMLAAITGFAVLLFVIFLIVAAHNISTEMEIDYKNIGILKSQGFTDRTIRYVYVLEYLVVELIGIILGVIISIPLERYLSRVFFTLTAILPGKSVPVAEILLFSVLLFVITFCFIYIFTRKVSKTSPVKAISNGREDYYFDSRLNAPVRKGFMGFWLGLRQITSAPKRYISVVVVTSLLVFTIITVELMSGFIKSRNALQSMGEPFLDIEFAFNGAEPACTVKDIENIVEKYTNIKGRVYKSHIYVSVNGENIQAQVKAYPEELSSLVKGRDVKYDNEIVITDQVKNLLDIDIGDEVTISRNDYIAEYMVVGIYQTMNDTGKAISMSLDGLSRLKEDPSDKYNINQLGMYGMVVEDATVGEKVVEEVKEKYGDDIEIVAHDFEKDANEFLDMFYVASMASEYTIYTLSFIFALITVIMVSAKAFIQERTDLGIYRATGFSVSKVRRQFACRFMIVCMISSIIGAVLGRLFSADMLSSLFSMFGVSHVELEYDFWFFFKPCLLFIAGYFIFGYISSRKVKKLSARELISE
ncbi:ABC-type transport system, involved in lipoprotein release, permease component [Lachnospiraceae bacterium NE2001]|nr:ABC-type transport system, involved in lipoprotein release, permease component [Lachnospiraceae bacterium NE2001]